MSKYSLSFSSPERSWFCGNLFASSRGNIPGATQFAFMADGEDVSRLRLPNFGEEEEPIINDSNKMSYDCEVVYEALGCRSCLARKEKKLGAPIVDQVQVFHNGIIVNLICEVLASIDADMQVLDEGMDGNNIQKPVKGQIATVVQAAVITIKTGCGERNGLEVGV